jgi:hypothetical protein
MSYAARHPDLFATALAYSGAPDIYYDADARIGAKVIINGTEFGLTRVPPDTFFGNQATDGINWAAHDPTTLASNLRWTRLALYFGNGLPGPYDNPWSPYAAFIEGAVERDSVDFHNRLQALGIPSLYDPYGNGTHIWPYWARDLRWSIGLIMGSFTHPLGPPRTVTFTSADPTFTVYGWRVALRRPAREFATLSGAGPGGFTLAGSGTATVTTPAAFRLGERLRITVSGSRVPLRAYVVTIGRSRRLTLTVPLGPGNRYQQDTPQAAVAGTAVYRTRVLMRLDIRRSAGRTSRSGASRQAWTSSPRTAGRCAGIPNTTC